MLSVPKGLFATILSLSFMLAPPAEARHSDYRLRLGANRGSKRTQARHKKSTRVVASARKNSKAKAVMQPQIGALLINESGEVLLDQLSDIEFNPASVTKLVTAYGAIKVFGLQHCFRTRILTDGELDEKSGVLNGNLYIQGSDPDFEREDALNLKTRLNEAGIKTVKGKLFVSRDFSYASTPNSAYAANALLGICKQPVKPIKFLQGCAVAEAPASTTQLGDYESESLKETLKEMLSYSENNVAEQIGKVAGGVKKIEQLVAEASGLQPGSLKLASASGLGKSRVKPKDMMLVLKALRQEMQDNGLDLQDICPLAGIDPGTLDERFTGPDERGSVVGKTGTLPGTDGGTSALAGMFRSKTDTVYFVIFCWRGNVPSFRRQQDELIRRYQAERGGALPFTGGYQDDLADSGV